MTNHSVVDSSAEVTASSVLRIFYDERPAGSGKTFAEIKNMVCAPGLYLLACDRREAIRERSELIHDLRVEHQSMIHVVTIMSSDQAEEHKRSSVRVQIEALPYTYRAGHVVALVTHLGLMDADLSGFRGWILVIDETPSIIESKQVSSPLTWPWLAEQFTILPEDGFMNAIIKTPDASATDAHFRRDTMAEPLAILHRRAAAPHYHVLTDLDAWSSLADEPTWRWTSIWSPSQLRSFDHIKVLANAFRRSLTSAVLRAIEPGIDWVEHNRPNERVFARRQMVICYFARAHAASRGLFDKPIGKQHLRRIAQWVSQEVGTDAHIWTSNERDRALLSQLPGERLTPRQAGSNRFAHVDCVSSIYSAKPSPDECAVLEALGIDPCAATDTREFETLYQFAGRSSVRDAFSSRPLRIYVYDGQQARYLADSFAASGYVDVELRPCDLGFLDWRYEAQAGRPRTAMTPEDLAAKADRTRVAARERKRRSRARAKERAGTSRGA